VESHTRNIYRKLAVGSRTEAVYEARRMGWLP
jgi:DNA-binding NarL/FixJ family response regulator